MTLNDAKLLGDLTATWISSILVVRRPIYQIIKIKFVSQWGKMQKYVGIAISKNEVHRFLTK